MSTYDKPLGIMWPSRLLSAIGLDASNVVAFTLEAGVGKTPTITVKYLQPQEPTFTPDPATLMRVFELVDAVEVTSKTETEVDRG